MTAPADQYHYPFDNLHHSDPVRDVMNLIEVPPNVELAQLCGLFALLDDRGKKTILALAASQAKLCSKA